MYRLNYLRFGRVNSKNSRKYIFIKDKKKFIYGIFGSKAYQYKPNRIMNINSFLIKKKNSFNLMSKCEYNKYKIEYYSALSSGLCSYNIFKVNNKYNNMIIKFIK